jgi:hypothetical protein
MRSSERNINEDPEALLCGLKNCGDGYDQNHIRKETNFVRRNASLQIDYKELI